MKKIIFFLGFAVNIFIFGSDAYSQEPPQLSNRLKIKLESPSASTTIPDLMDRVANRYTSNQKKSGRIHVQALEFIGKHPESHILGFIYPERGALLESNQVRYLYKTLINSQSSPLIPKQTLNEDEYIYKSSL